MAYLYGASVQGIQGFIFQTNKLKEIVGASELVEQICTTKFLEVAGILNDDKNLIINAAGNIKYIFEDKTKCEHLVRIFPKVIIDFAPGITISQAVVTLSGDLSNDIDCLEQRLKAQRSKASMPVETGFMGLERDRRAGGVAFISRIKRKGGIEEICEATHKKLQKSDPDYQYREEQQKENLFFKISNKVVSKEEVPHDVEKITESGKNSWLAIIHADGNALGILLQTLGKKLKENKFLEEKVKTAFSTFSKSLDAATKKAAQIAFENIIKVDLTKYKYPIRPVILGGDDLTVIIRADLALDFTIEFLKAFETQTEKQFAFLKTDYNVEGFENGITACAGIAYIKESYPFHYGVDLAEKLTSKAKRFSKQEKFKKNEGINIPPSSISFYKVQSSFIESLDDMTKKTLTADISNVSFDYGPYLIHTQEGEANVGMLKHKLTVLEDEAKKRDKSKGVSKLRQWISELYKDKSTADFMLERMKVVNDEFYKKLQLDDEKKKDKTIIYDVIQLHTLKY